jgi:hypothetical protein
MTLALTTWLLLAVLLCAYAWFRRAWLLLPTLLAALALSFAPLSHPAFWQPPAAKYTVYGARIVPNQGIWILLADGGNEPVYYRLPYSKQQAEQLQMLMDVTGGEPGAIAMSMGEGGEPDFSDGRPQTETKQAERPIYGG